MNISKHSETVLRQLEHDIRILEGMGKHIGKNRREFERRISISSMDLHLDAKQCETLRRRLIDSLDRTIPQIECEGIRNGMLGRVGVLKSLPSSWNAKV